MNLDEMREQWRAYDRKLDRAIQLNERTIRIIEVRRSLSGVVRSEVATLALNAVGVLLLGDFLAAHLSEPEFGIPALALGLVLVWHIALSVRQWMELKTLDYGGPVLLIQRKLAVLRLLRVWTVKWTLWLSPLLWMPLLVVALKGALGLNAYELFPPSYLAANLGFGVIFLALMIGLARHYRGRIEGSPQLERLRDHLAGRSLSEARARLREMAEFERGMTNA